MKKDAEKQWKSNAVECKNVFYVNGLLAAFIFLEGSPLGIILGIKFEIPWIRTVTLNLASWRHFLETINVNTSKLNKLSCIPFKLSEHNQTHPPTHIFYP